MVSGAAQLPTPPVGAHLVLYDGVCGLCDRLIQFLLHRDHRRVFVFASLQSETGCAMVRRFGGNPEELTSFYVIADYQDAAGRFLTRSDASLFVAGQLGWPWRAALAARCVPKWIRDRAYDLIARTRYRVFGQYDQCHIPTQAVRNRFID